MLNLVENDVKTFKKVEEDIKYPYEILDDYIKKKYYPIYNFHYWCDSLNTLIGRFGETDVDTLIDKIIEGKKECEKNFLLEETEDKKYPYFFGFFNPFEPNYRGTVEELEKELSSIFPKDNIKTPFCLFLNDFEILKKYIKEKAEAVVDVNVNWDRNLSSGEEAVSLKDYDLEEIKSWSGEDVSYVFGEVEEYDDLCDQVAEVSNPYLIIK